MKIKFTIERLKRMPRPAGYLDELRTCAVSADDRSMTFDTDQPGYKALKEKYRDHPREMACRHRGEQIDSVKCETCNGNVMAKVMACEIHQRCTLFGKPIEGVKSCRGCDDRAA